MEFRAQYTQQKRAAESSRIMQMYPDRIPVICELAKYSDMAIPVSMKKKYLVPVDLTLGQFVYVLRKHMRLGRDNALFIFIGGAMPCTSQLLKTTYNEHKNTDGFLYITYSNENTFGSRHEKLNLQ